MERPLPLPDGVWVCQQSSPGTDAIASLSGVVDMKVSRAVGGVTGLAAAAWAGQVRRSVEVGGTNVKGTDRIGRNDRRDTRYGRPIGRSVKQRPRSKRQNKRPKTGNMQSKSSKNKPNRSLVFAKGSPWNWTYSIPS